jgi:hypothetical protein
VDHQDLRCFIRRRAVVAVRDRQVGELGPALERDRPQRGDLDTAGPGREAGRRSVTDEDPGGLVALIGDGSI